MTIFIAALSLRVERQGDREIGQEPVLAPARGLVRDFGLESDSDSDSDSAGRFRAETATPARLSSRAGSRCG
jgi:hypothetical protein